MLSASLLGSCDSSVGRRRFLQQCAAGLTSAGASSGVRKTAEVPNIVLIVADNLGRGLGCRGNPVILTGQYAHANGMYGLSHAYHHFASFNHVKSLPVMLSEAGFRTASAGKLHVEPASVYRFDTRIEADSRNPVEVAENSLSFLAAEAPLILYFCPYDPHRGRPFTTWPEPNSFGNRPDGYPGVRAEV